MRGGYPSKLQRSVVVGCASEGSALEACGGATGFSPWGLHILILSFPCKRESRRCPSGSWDTIRNGFLLEFTPYLIRGRNDKRGIPLWTPRLGGHRGPPLQKFYPLGLIFRRYFLSISRAMMDALSRTIESSPPREYSWFSISVELERE